MGSKSISSTLLLDLFTQKTQILQSKSLSIISFRPPAILTPPQPAPVFFHQEQILPSLHLDKLGPGSHSWPFTLCTLVSKFYFGLIFVFIFIYFELADTVYSFHL